MTREEFALWRTRMGLTQPSTAELLGVSKRTVQAWEAGENMGKPYPVPKYIGLACAALSAGLAADGPRSAWLAKAAQDGTLDALAASTWVPVPVAPSGAQVRDMGEAATSGDPVKVYAAAVNARPSRP